MTFIECQKEEIVLKFCSSCGAEINEGAVVCVKCGAAVAGTSSQTANAPAGRLKTNKSLAKFIFLSIITLGIYGLVVMSSVSNDINIVATRYDGKKTMHYCLLFFLIAPITLGIAYIVWFHKISNRIGNELRRRNIVYSFSCADYWLWNVIGSLIAIGPFIYYHKLFKSINLICNDYNQKG